MPIKSLLKQIRLPFAKKGGHPVESSLRYRFKNRDLLETALRHRSHAYASQGSRKNSNERLEFLGDAVLDLVVTDYLYGAYPRKNEGELSKIKSLIVSKMVLRKVAEELDIGKHVYLSRSEERSGGRKRTSIVADALEAVLGGIYVDGGLEPARDLVHRTVLKDINRFLKDRRLGNYKSQLLEAAQKLQLGMPVYNVDTENGPDHNKTFEITVSLGGEPWGHGKGKNKKSAEQEAARNALELKKDELETLKGRGEA